MTDKQLTPEDFIRVPETESMECTGCYFEDTECWKNPLADELGDCGYSPYRCIFKLKSEQQ